MRDQIKNENPEAGLEVFLDEFIDDRYSDLEKLWLALELKKFSEIKDIAHRLKGFCAPYGFNLLEKISIELEKVALDKDLNKATKYITQMSEYLELKKENLKE